MKNLKNLLNPQQYEAATTIDGAVLVFAGAGTGKTRVITYRIAYMISKGIPPENILAVTFTNKSAKEMKERVGELIRSKKQPYISTFHSFSLYVLRRDIDRLGYRKNFSIYDESDQMSILKKIVKDVWPHLVDKIKIQDVKTAISSYKDKFIHPKTSISQAKNPDEVVNSSIYKEYQNRLKLFNALDFDDLIITTLVLFEKYPDVLEKYQDQFKYIMIDEYQDTNYTQFLLTNKIAKKYGNLCVVGDDDQSIYGWRGADSGNILQFDKYYPNTKIINLEQNYRSTKTILEAANSVIKNNVYRREKKLWSARKEDKPITLFSFPTARDESKEIIKTILDHKLRNNLRFKDFAILIRTLHQSRLFEKQLRHSKIPYVFVGGTRFFDRKEIKDIVSFLKFIINPNDEVSLLRIINTPPRSVGITTLKSLNKYCLDNKVSLIKAIKNIDTIETVNKRSAVAIKDFMKIISDYREQFEKIESNQTSNTLAQLITDFIKDIFYEREVARISDDRAEIESRMQNVYDLIEDIRYFEEQGNDTGSLKNYLNYISLDSGDSKTDMFEDRLTLITLHSCKGLEFPIVFMVGLEDGILPHTRSMDENNGDISEERRLCYVGITRAQKELYLSYCLGRTKYGELSVSSPSRFLREIPDSLIAQPQDSYSEEDMKKIDQFYLEKLKKL